MKGISYYEQKVAEVEQLVTQLLIQLKDKSFYSRPYIDRFKQLGRLKKLLSNLIGPKDKVPLPQLLLASVALIFSSCEFPDNWYGVKATEFANPIKDPFGLVMEGNVNPGYLNIVNFADTDGDGDLDVSFSRYFNSSSGSYNPRTVRNEGSKTLADFSGMSTYGTDVLDGGYSNSVDALSIADLDNDGNLEIVFQAIGNSFLRGLNLGAYEPGNSYLLNGFSKTYNYESISLVDLDGDGDYDFAGSFNDKLVYWENIGTKASHNFANRQVNPHDISFNGKNTNDAGFIDIDGDGDEDLFATSGQDILFIENRGDAQNPEFIGLVTNPSTTGLISPKYNLTLSFADIDNDGDQDLFVLDRFTGTPSGTPADAMYFFENLKK